MDLDWGRLAERRMLAAVAEGKLDHLKGEGQPIPPAPPTNFVDPGEAIGMRIMAEAGYVPEEVRLRARLEQRRADWRAARTEADRRVIMAEIADLQMRESIAREARLALSRRRH